MSGARRIITRYEDPLDVVWLAAARAFGMTVECTHEVFASWDGAGTLRIAAPEDRDPDDSLAQLVFHEICHALVEGPDGWHRPDWGLSNRDERDLVREHACQRLQAALADAYGLRQFLAVTTDLRPYYDALPEEPLAAGDDPAIAPAQAAWERARSSEPLHRALAATAAIARAVSPDASPDSLWSRAGSP